jgi:hypothetical protein
MTDNMSDFSTNELINKWKKEINKLKKINQPKCMNNSIN